MRGFLGILIIDEVASVLNKNGLIVVVVGKLLGLTASN